MAEISLPPECAQCGYLHSELALCASVRAMAQDAGPGTNAPWCSECEQYHSYTSTYDQYTGKRIVTGCERSLTEAENRRRYAAKVEAVRRQAADLASALDASGRALEVEHELNANLAQLARRRDERGMTAEQYAAQQARLDRMIDEALASR